MYRFLVCALQYVCNALEPIDRSLKSADVWGILDKSLKHNHIEIHNIDGIVGVINKPWLM